MGAFQAQKNTRRLEGHHWQPKWLRWSTSPFAFHTSALLWLVALQSRLCRVTSKPPMKSATPAQELLERWEPGLLQQHPHAA